MQEKIIQVGLPTPINGVLCQPDNQNEDAPVVIILNSGLMHHVGTCRLSVKLARSLADKGVSSARIDFPGVGDSLMRRGRTKNLECSPKELADVMDELERATGKKRFVLFGLCSGADASFATALVERRVVGIAQIDPYLFRTKKWYINHYLPRFFDFKVWGRWLLALFNVFNKSSTNESSTFIEYADEAREMLSRDDVVNGYKKIIDNGVAIQVVVTGGQAYSYNYPKQFYDIYKGVTWGDNLNVTYYPKAEHIITEPEYQEKVKDLIINWVLQKTTV